MTARDIRGWVAARYGLKPQQLLRQRRGEEEPGAKLARYEAMALVRAELRFTLTQIGRNFGGFHHSTVLHGITHRVTPERLAELRGEMRAHAEAVQVAKEAQPDREPIEVELAVALRALGRRIEALCEELAEQRVARRRVGVAGELARKADAA